MTQLTGDNPAVGAPSRTAAASSSTAAPSLLADLHVLTKPRIAVMVAVTVSIAYVMGLRADGAGSSIAGAMTGQWLTLALTILGTALCCMSSAVLNQVIERRTDALMKRTADRPLASGRMSPTPAAALGLMFAVTGLLILNLFANPLTAGLIAFTIASYALIYTPLKRVTSLSTIVGAVPGALPPVAGYAAATGRIGIEAVLLFAILFLWQLPHFLSIAWLYREDYARAGMPMLPVLEPDGHSTFRQILVGCLALLPLGLMPTMLGVSGMIYFAGALLAGIAFLASGVAVVLRPTTQRARVMFYVSLVYVPVVFALMLVDQTT